MVKVQVHETAKPSESIKTSDGKGRSITVRALNPVEVYRLMRLTKASPSDGHFSMAMLAASVREIDGSLENVGNEVQIEAMLQRLGFDGIEAVSKALASSNMPEGNEVPLR